MYESTSSTIEIKQERLPLSELFTDAHSNDLTIMKFAIALAVKQL